jgi:HEPN domain-containing protein
MNEFITLSSQYWQAAESLYSKEGIPMPVIFLYLHSMECLMKGLLECKGELSSSLKKTHDLARLAIALGVYDDTIEALGNLDPSLTAFRYPSERQDISIDSVREYCLHVRNRLGM